MEKPPSRKETSTPELQIGRKNSLEVTERNNVDQTVDKTAERDKSPDNRIIKDLSSELHIKFNQSMQKQNIGANQLKASLEEILKLIHVEQWKNIPMPVCAATSGLLTCVNDLKKFSLYMEQRFSNLTNSTAQNSIDVFDLAKKFKEEANQALWNAETELNEKMTAMNAHLTNLMDEKLQKLKLESEAWVIETIRQELNILKPWIGKLADDKIMGSERKQTADYMKKIRETKDMFNVPELIGLHCRFTDYPDFTSKVHNQIVQINQLLEVNQAKIDIQTSEQAKMKAVEEGLELGIATTKSEFQQLLDHQSTELGHAIQNLERLQQRSDTALKERIKEQDLGQDTRVKLKLVCQDWNDKTAELDVLSKNSSIIQKKIDKLRDGIERIESEMIYKDSKNEKIQQEMSKQLQQQEIGIQEVMQTVNGNPKLFTGLQKKKTMKQSTMQSEKEKKSAKGTDQQVSSTIVVESQKSEIGAADQDKTSEPNDETYMHKKKKSKRGSTKRSSHDRITENSNRTSQQSLKKQQSIKTQKDDIRIRANSAQGTLNQRAYSAKPAKSNFTTVQDVDMNNVNYDRDINVASNMDILEIEDLADRVKLLEKQVTQLKLAQSNAVKMQEKERKKLQRAGKSGADMSLAGILELGKNKPKAKRASLSNSPENKQQNAQTAQQQRPLQWEGDKKKWVREPMPQAGFNMQMDNPPVFQDRSRSRDHMSKNSALIRDQLNYLKQAEPSVGANLRSAGNKGADRNAQIHTYSVNALPKSYAQGMMLNNPSHKGLGSESQSQFDKKQMMVIMESDLLSDQVTNQYQSVKQTVFERKPTDILQSHASMYYKLDGTVKLDKRRPLTGVKAQALTSGLILQQNSSDCTSSPPRTSQLPPLKEKTVKDLIKPGCSNQIRTTVKIGTDKN